MSSLLQNDNGIEAVDKTAIANHDAVPGVGQGVAEPDPLVPRDLIPISDLSLKDDIDCAQDKDAIKRRLYDELVKRGKENGTAASSGGSHKYSTRRNLSNMGSSLSGTPPSTEGFREDMMAHWFTKTPWPSGPSFLSDNLTEEAQHSRGIARSSVLASVGSSFMPEAEKQDDYPRQILIEETIEGVDRVPAETPTDDC